METVGGQRQDLSPPRFTLLSPSKLEYAPHLRSTQAGGRLPSGLPIQACEPGQDQDYGTLI